MVNALHPSLLINDYWMLITNNETSSGAYLGFFRAGEFSWNYDTSINIHLQHEKERPCREKYPVFSPGNS